MPRQEDRLLGALATRSKRRRIHRLQSNPVGDFLTELGLDPQSDKELREIRSKAGYRPDPNALLDAPFGMKRRYREHSRFSDGSFPVFYSSLDMETAQAEICFHFLKYCGAPENIRPVHYQQLSCTFDGSEKDLRSKLAEWPHLTHETNYAFCNKLGAEARESGVDGLVTPSARHDGTNLPVFNRKALSNAQLGEVVQLRLNPATGKYSITVV